MRCVTVSLLMLAVVILAGCETRSPVSPAATATNFPAPLKPTPPTAPVWNWNLTTVLTAVTGPDNCFTQQQFRAGIPRSISWQLEVTRTDNVITFDYDVRNFPTDDVRQTGTVDGSEFSARSVSGPMFFPTCPDGTVLSGTFDASVTGRFSDDGRHLTAKEVWAYHFSSARSPYCWMVCGPAIKVGAIGCGDQPCAHAASNTLASDRPVSAGERVRSSAHASLLLSSGRSWRWQRPVRVIVSRMRSHLPFDCGHDK